MKFRAFAAAVSLWLLAAGSSEAISIQFDYTYDSNNFFSGANVGRRSLLNAAAQVFTTPLSDSLTAITPSGSNTWSALFDNPSTGAALSLSNLSIGANTVVVFVGAQSLGGSTLGYGGPGGWSAGGNQAWFNTIEARGQAGALAVTPTDFATWGGAITFNLGATWYFDSDPTTMESFAGVDFYSVAVHELGHLLGIGTADSWNAKISGTKFTGAKTTAANGGVQISLSGDLGHFANGTMSRIYGTNTSQEAEMDPSITTGTRKYFTNLDYAALQDVGWTMVPEPSTWLFLGLGVALTAGTRRRRRYCI